MSQQNTQNRTTYKKTLQLVLCAGEFATKPSPSKVCNGANVGKNVTGDVQAWEKTQAVFAAFFCSHCLSNFVMIAKISYLFLFFLTANLAHRVQNSFPISTINDVTFPGLL